MKKWRIVQDNACKNLAEVYVNTIDDDILALYNAGYRKEEFVRVKSVKDFYSMIMKGREMFSKDNVITISQFEKCLKEFLRGETK